MISLESTTIPDGYKPCPHGLPIMSYKPFNTWYRRISNNSRIQLRKALKKDYFVLDMDQPITKLEETQ